MHQSNNAAKLIEEINLIKAPDEFNYSFVQPMEGFYQVFKRSNIDPYKAYAVIQMAVLRNYPFLDTDELMKKICEYVGEQEHKYNKEKKNES